MRWFDELPPLARGALFIGGVLMSTFSNSFPTWFQTAGLWLGISSASFGIIASILHWVNEWRGKRGKAKFKLAAWHFLKWKFYVPLYEAAQRTLDSNIVISPHTSPAIDDIRRLEGNGSENIITWYCNFLKNKIDIYGCHVPSTKMEKFVQPDYDFRVEDSVVIATEKSGNGRWERLAVLEGDLRAVIRATNVAR